jgi:DNA-binding LytR/AlgR family response regulator
MRLRTIAVDDEPLALQLVKSYILKTPFLEHIGSFESSVEALQIMSEGQVELAFMDIQMPDLTGTELTKSLIDGPKIIFTTAYEKYALESYKLDAVDYLLKPFGYEDFLRASQKALKLIVLERNASSQIDPKNEFIFIKSEYKIRRIRLDKILFIEGLKDYIKIFVENETRPIFSLNSLKNLEDKLPGSQFMRVHRSFIVNLDKIETIDRSRIVMGNHYIAVSAQYKDKFQEYLDKNFL